MDDYSVAVDVGGTFTDIVLCNLATNKQRVHKTPSTPDDPSTGFLTGLKEVLAANSVEASQVKHVFHGTTIATNAILENKGSPVGLLVPEGFKFVLEIGRHGTPRLVNPQSWVKPERPVRPRDIVEVSERAGFSGEVLVPLDEDAVRAAARKFKADEITSIAVSFLHSYSNPTHENRAKELILEEFPNAQVSISSEVLAVFREYERTMTTVLNAYVMPRVSNYIGNLESSLQANAVDSSFSIMKSNGGMIGADIAVRQPVHTALSGPAAGVMATLQIAENTGVSNSISFDMGGTSTDVSLLLEGRPTTNLAGRLGNWPIQLPMLDIATIGCGGGSIANVSPYGSLTVGPASAGSVPGPVCYGLGGEAPTVTDANLVLGRLEPTLGGKLILDGAAAERVVARLGDKINLSALEAAEAIISICCENMAQAIKLVLIDRGRDPRDFVLASFGGAGAMHACVIARAMSIPKIIVLALYDRIPRKEVKFTRRNIFLRDKYTCQYCSNSFPENDLNLDHVVPRDKGGKTTWDNIATSCIRCNTRKANKLAHEVGMRLLRKPATPRWRPLFGMRSETPADESWTQFLYPDRENVSVSG